MIETSAALDHRSETLNVVRQDPQTKTIAGA
jgi:hypothetical protein